MFLKLECAELVFNKTGRRVTTYSELGRAICGPYMGKLLTMLICSTQVA